MVFSLKEEAGDNASKTIGIVYLKFVCGVYTAYTSVNSENITIESL